MSIFSICKHTTGESFESGHLNQQTTSLKYTLITPRLRQNQRNRAFGMLVTGMRVNALQVCFVALVLLFITS